MAVLALLTAAVIVASQWPSACYPALQCSSINISTDLFPISWPGLFYPAFPVLTPTTQPFSNIQPPPSDKYVLYDNFNSYNNNKWTISSYRPDSDFIDTTFTTGNVWFQDGKLVLRSYVDDHTGGELKSDDKYSYGKYRASIKIDQTPGTCLTFFSYTPDASDGHNELDWEMIEEDGVYKAIMTTWVNGVRNHYKYTLPFDPGAAYHVYGYDWYKDHVDFFIDDMAKPVWTSNSYIPDQAMYLYFNNWVVVGPPGDHGNGMNTEYVDWVTVEPLD